jgi:hypothetical protein
MEQIEDKKKLVKRVLLAWSITNGLRILAGSEEIDSEEDLLKLYQEACEVGLVIGTFDEVKMVWEKCNELRGMSTKKLEQLVDEEYAHHMWEACGLLGSPQRIPTLVEVETFKYELQFLGKELGFDGKSVKNELKATSWLHIARASRWELQERCKLSEKMANQLLFAATLAIHPEAFECARKLCFVKSI